MSPLSSKAFQNVHLKHALTTTTGSIMFLLRTLLIRHSKAQVEASGAMRLPPKTEHNVEVHMSRDEWEVYAEAWKNVRCCICLLATALLGTRHLVARTQAKQCSRFLATECRVASIWPGLYLLLNVSQSAVFAGAC